MAHQLLLSLFALPALALIPVASEAADAPLIAGPPIALAGTHGRFDFLAIDAQRQRLLAAHTGNGSLDVIDLGQGKLLKSIPVGNAQGSAIDPKQPRYFASVSKPPKLSVIDADRLEETGSVNLSGPADVMAYDPVGNLAYVCHDDAKEVWAVDPDQKKVAATIQLPSDSPEDLAIATDGKRLLQNVKSSSEVAVIDLSTHQIAAKWTTAPAQSPHGIALVADQAAFLVAGGTGKLALFSQTDGRLLSACEIAERVDQIAYDPGMHRAYCASGTGKISVVDVGPGKLTRLADAPSADGAHSIAVDPNTHNVWIAYAKGDVSYIQSFALPK